MRASNQLNGAAVQLESLVKSYGSFRAVDAISLNIPAGSFVTLLGPSGSGKTTTLNLIAGFIEPDGGEIRADGHVISYTPPHKRNIGMVFQSYALFPHMTVSDNVEFPLRMRSSATREKRQRMVHEALALVRLDGFERRYPRQLSGGQQQRVSMARALVSQPRLLLMDEPLGALDKKLREEMQLEIKQIHERVGSTFIYVTHDQGEALTMSDLVVVMNRGRIVQKGSPRQIYAEPVTEFVADFLGHANLLPARVTKFLGDDAELALAIGGMAMVPRGEHHVSEDDEVLLLIRTEAITLTQTPVPSVDVETLRGTLIETVYLGDTVRQIVSVGDHRLAVKSSGTDWTDWPIGTHLHLSWPRMHGRIVLRDKR